MTYQNNLITSPVVSSLLQLIRYRGYLKQVVVLGLLSLILGGCGPEVPILLRMNPLPDEPVCRVAVLPFSTDSDYPLAGLITYKIFAEQFSALDNAWVAQEGDVLKIYQQMQIFPGQILSSEQMKILANRLNVQVIFKGHVLEMRENPSGIDSVNPILAMNIDIIDGNTTDTLWSTYHRRQGSDYQKALHFGQIQSAAGLCQKISEEIITLWLKKGFKQCNVLN